MLNFEFHNPTKIIFGQGEISRLNTLITGEKVLLLYGEGSIKRNGVYDQVLTGLNKHTVFEIRGVRPNPTYDKALEAIELVRKEKIDFILAVGGGSVIDTAKFVSLAVHYNGEPWDILVKRDLTHKKAVPYGSVLTLPATGSEMNCYFVITKGDDKLSSGHPLLYPQFSVLDPSITFTLDSRQVGNGIVDAFVHVMEQYLTYPVNAPLQDRFAESILMTLIEEGPKSLKSNSYEARSNHMWCATMALSSVIGVGVPHDWSTHMIGHELTAIHNMDHGRTLAVILPAMMWAMREEKRAKINQYAERIWKLKGTDEELLRGAIRKTSEFFESMGLPTKLNAYQIKEDIIPLIISRLDKRGFSPIGERNLVTLDKIKEILRFALQ